MDLVIEIFYKLLRFLTVIHTSIHVHVLRVSDMTIDLAVSFTFFLLCSDLVMESGDDSDDGEEEEEEDGGEHLLRLPTLRLLAQLLGRRK